MLRPHRQELEMKKYAIDLTGDEVIIDKSGRNVIIDWIDESFDGDHFMVHAYFEDNGDEWTRQLESDSVVNVHNAN